MPHLAADITIESPPEAVYEALLREEGLSRWWTADAAVTPEVGAVAVFGFYDRAIVTAFRIEELSRARRIRWHCVDGPVPYLGSEVVFDLEATPAGTTVHFAHRHLDGDEAFVAHAGQSWKRVLTSLKAYVETGSGTPISM